jgi:SPP1 family predicted phage head-tail adaptor
VLNGYFGRTGILGFDAMAFGIPQQWAGKLDRQIKLLHETTEYNEMNEPIQVWEQVATMWANVQHKTVEEIIAGQAVRAVKQTRFLVRWRTDINEKDRIEHDGLQYLITGLAEMGRREMLEITTEHVEGAAE